MEEAEVDRTEEMRMYNVIQNMLKMSKVEIIKRKPKICELWVDTQDEVPVVKLVENMGFKYTGSMGIMLFYENSKFRFVFVRKRNHVEIAIHERLE